MLSVNNPTPTEGILRRRLDRNNFKGAGKPIFAGGNIHYEMSERTRAIGFGGVGAIHEMVRRLKLDEAIYEIYPWYAIAVGPTLEVPGLENLGDE